MEAANARNQVQPGGRGRVLELEATGTIISR